MREIDIKIISMIKKGDRTSSDLCGLSYSNRYIYKRIRHLIDNGYIKKLSRGVYEVTDKGDDEV